jgi:hypothetical protein
MPGDPALAAGACDSPAWQAARLLSGAAQDAARAWILPVPRADILDVTWDLRQTLCDLGAALWRLSRFRDEAATDGPPPARLDEPGSHVYRAGSAAERTGAFLRDREVLEHVRHCIARGLPVGGDPHKCPAAVTAALELADSAAMAYRIVGRSPSGTRAERDDAVGAFMRVTDNLDAAVRNLAVHVPGPHSARLAVARAGLEETCTHLREALICSAVDFRQPRSGLQLRAMRARYPVLPSRSRPAPDATASQTARLADAGFPPGSVIEALGSAQQAAPRPAERASHRPPLRSGPGSAP